jgi:hypothetical protein
VSEDFGAAGAATSYVLRLHFGVSVDCQPVSVTVNGRALRAPRFAADWLEFPVTAAELRTGFNEIVVALDGTAKKPLKWLDLMLRVRHGSVP